MPNPSTIAMADEEAMFHEMLGGGYKNQPYWYLAGPMSGLPGYNFAAFHKAAGALRAQGYNIINPAELNHEIMRAVSRHMTKAGKELNSVLTKHGIKVPSWDDCLKRDLDIVSDHNCIGIICIDGWELSRGAQFETYVANKWGKPIMVYRGNNTLEQIVRRAALDAAGVID